MNRTKTTHLGIIAALAAAGRHDAASFCNAHTFCQGRHKRRATLATVHDGEDSGPLDGEDHLNFRRRGGGGVSGGRTSTRLDGRADRGGSDASGGGAAASRRLPAAGAASQRGRKGVIVVGRSGRGTDVDWGRARTTARVLLLLGEAAERSSRRSVGRESGIDECGRGRRRWRERRARRRECDERLRGRERGVGERGRQRQRVEGSVGKEAAAWACV